MSWVLARDGLDWCSKLSVSLAKRFYRNSQGLMHCHSCLVFSRISEDLLWTRRGPKLMSVREGHCRQGQMIIQVSWCGNYSFINVHGKGDKFSWNSDKSVNLCWIGTSMFMFNYIYKYTFQFGYLLAKSMGNLVDIDMYQIWQII